MGSRTPIKMNTLSKSIGIVSVKDPPILKLIVSTSEESQWTLEAYKLWFSIISCNGGGLVSQSIGWMTRSCWTVPSYWFSCHVEISLVIVGGRIFWLGVQEFPYMCKRGVEVTHIHRRKNRVSLVNQLE